MKRIFGLLCGLLFFTHLAASPPPKPVLKWQIGEQLVYKVKYMFLTVGTLKLQVADSVNINNRTAYLCRIYIDSNPDLPFVTIHDVYESYIDKAFYSHQFYAYENKNDHVIFTDYTIDYTTHTVHMLMQKWTPEDTVQLLDSTAAVPDKVQDSLSLLYYARAMAKHSIKMDVPVFAYNDLKYTSINFTAEQRTEDDLTGYYLDGKIKFVGIAGIKDDFKGLFSPDEQSVPMLAFMKAFIGSVKIELELFENWEPTELTGYQLSK